MYHFYSPTLQAQTEHPGDSAHSHRWTSLELVKGTYSTDDSPSDIAEIRLDKAVPLKVHRLARQKYISIFFRRYSFKTPLHYKPYFKSDTIADFVTGRSKVCCPVKKLWQQDS